MLEVWSKETGLAQASEYTWEVIMFTRKHYKAIAEILKQHKVNSEVVADFARYFAADNERFNKQQFYNACGLEYYGW